MNYKVPYDFILRHLYPVRPKIRKMLGCYALVDNNKILFFLRDKEKQPEYNGVYIGTQPIYFDALQTEIHHSHMDSDIDGTPHSWIFLSEDLNDFEDKVLQACELVKAGDVRIGK